MTIPPVPARTFTPEERKRLLEKAKKHASCNVYTFAGEEVRRLELYEDALCALEAECAAYKEIIDALMGGQTAYEAGAKFMAWIAVFGTQHTEGWKEAFRKLEALEEAKGADGSLT